MQPQGVPPKRARPDELSIREALQTGREHHQAGRLSHAEAIYRQVLEAAPDHPDAMILELLDLDFLGFSLEAGTMKKYRQRFPQDLAAASLDCWDDFEKEFPGAFAGMYLFWAQKRGAVSALPAPGQQ